MNLLHLRYFVELAGIQHYTRAAEKLCITQPSLSHAIAQLEVELGVPLFEKSGRGVVLTPYGKQFLSCAQLPYIRTRRDHLVKLHSFCPAKLN